MSKSAVVPYEEDGGKSGEFRPNPPGLDGVPDLSMLLYLEEDNVLHNLKCRYKDKKVKKPYTSISTVLVAINPYEQLGIYGPDKIARIAKNSEKGRKSEPHVFTVAARSYRIMLSKKRNQSIIVCGESGAGKSESAKYMMRYLAYTAEQARAQSGVGSSIQNSMIEQQVLAATPILESFGNAKTVLNNNSSRFGKFTKLLFSNQERIGDFGRILGSSLSTYLLEKSRVVHQDNSERNFHIFYQLTRGAPAAMKKELGLEKFDHLHYLNQGGDPRTAVPGMSDESRFRELQDSLKLMRIDKRTQTSVFKIISAILHLGNVKFAENAKSYSDITPESKPFVAETAKLFGLSAEGLQKRLTSRTVKVRLETIDTPLTMAEAPQNRDAIAKSMYHALFNWLVRRINNELLVEEDSDDSDYDEKEAEVNQNLFIGILDVFGFESFKLNSFEQFCINFANERLQGFFNQHIIKSEQEEYVREGIFWKPLKVPDNSEILDLIDNSRNGIYKVLDAACLMPKGTPTIFSRELFKAHARHPRLKTARAPRRPGPGEKWSQVPGSKGFVGFTVKHYAGEVIYSCERFLEKNNDKIHDDTQVLMETSNDPVIPQILEDPSEKFHNRRKKRGAAFKSVGTEFSKQLNQLMEVLRSTSPFFVRCVNPNNSKSGVTFDGDYVRSQLRCGGLVEALRVIKLGYPTRIQYKVIYDQFSDTLDHPLIANFGERDFCQAILIAFGLQEEHYELGLTKVFFKPNKAQVLDEIVAWGTKPLSEKHLDLITKWIVTKRWLKLRGLMRACTYTTWGLRSIRSRQKLYKVVSFVEVYTKTFGHALVRARKRINKRNELNAVVRLQAVLKMHLLQVKMETARAKREAHERAEKIRIEREKAEMRRLEEERKRRVAEAKRKAEEEERRRLAEIKRLKEERERIERERAEAERRRIAEEEEARRRLAEIENERQRKEREAELQRLAEERARERAEHERMLREENERLEREARAAQEARIAAIKDENERQAAIINQKKRRREAQRLRILRMQRQMEEELAHEMRLLEELEEKENEQRRARELQMREEAEQRRKEEARKRAEAKREAERPKFVRAPTTLARPSKNGAAPAQEEPVDDDQFKWHAQTGELFLRHSLRGRVGKKKVVTQERFIKLSLDEDDKPYMISWGAGEKSIQLANVLFVVHGHYTPSFKNSKADTVLCFSLVTPKKSLNLEAFDAETAERWVRGLRSILGHTAEQSDEAATNFYEAKALRREERRNSATGRPRRKSKSKQDRGDQSPGARPRKRENSMVLLQQDLFVMTVTTVFRHIEEEGLWVIPENYVEEYPAAELYKRALTEKVPWRDWNEWIKRELVADLTPSAKRGDRADHTIRRQRKTTESKSQALNARTYAEPDEKDDASPQQHTFQNGDTEASSSATTTNTSAGLTVPNYDNDSERDNDSEVGGASSSGGEPKKKHRRGLSAAFGLRRKKKTSSGGGMTLNIEEAAGADSDAEFKVPKSKSKKSKMKSPSSIFRRKKKLKQQKAMHPDDGPMF